MVKIKNTHKKTRYKQRLVLISEYILKALESWVYIFVCVYVYVWEHVWVHVKTGGQAGHREETGGAGDTGVVKE